MRRRNPNLGMVELWHRLRQRGYTRRPESLFRVMRKLGLFPQKEKKPAYKPKALPADDLSRTAYPGRCEGGPPAAALQTLNCAYTNTLLLTSSHALRFLAAYPEQSTYASADFLKKLFKWYARRGIRVECVQTDNGFEFTNRFSNSKRDLPTLFETTAAQLGIRHKLIRPYTPRHNGKVERSHREDQKPLLFLPQFLLLG